MPGQISGGLTALEMKVERASWRMILFCLIAHFICFTETDRDIDLKNLTKLNPNRLARLDLAEVLPTVLTISRYGVHL